jgi:flagellar biosynthetic protein FlhB
MISFSCLYLLGGYMFGILKSSSTELLTGMGTYQVTAEGVHALMLRMVLNLGKMLAPFLLCVMAGGIIVSLGQGGFHFSTERIGFKPEKLNPLNGMKRLFNKDSLVEVVKSLLKIAIVGYVSWRLIRGETERIVLLSQDGVPQLVEYFGHLAFRLVVNSCAVLFILALLDLAFVKWRFVQNIKMTKQEVKEEHKESEGDPQVKGKIRGMQMERARRRLSQIIPTADVVITNPTHFAVALKYDRGSMGAPIVLAKGADHLALKIKEIARESRVTIVENRMLARSLYAKVKEGEEIPESLYAAVAEILAYVYGLKGRL